MSTRAFRPLPLLVLAAAFATSARAALPKLTCAQTSRCPAGVLSQVRDAADATCPCDAAASSRAYARCWKPVVRGFVKSLGKKGFPKACRKEVTGVLNSTTCGRSGFVLCRKTKKSGSPLCTIAKASRCRDVFPTGSGFRSCTDACEGQAALPFPSTVELRGTELASLAADPGDGTLTFAVAPASLANVAVGQVIVAGVSASTPAGLLRVVIAVERNGQQLTLRTMQAPIQLAYASLHVHGTHATPLTSGSPATTPAIVPLTDFGTKKQFSYVLFDGDGDKETTNDQVAIDGEIGGGFDYDYALDFDWPSLDSLPGAVGDCLKSLGDILTGHLPDCSVQSFLPEAKVTFVVHPQINANANVHGAALLGYEKEIPLASETLPPIPVGPLIFVPKAEIKANLMGGASGEFSTGVHGSAVFETKVTVSSKHTGTPDYESPVLQSTDFAPNDTKISLKAQARVSVEASLNLLLFDVTGPYATAAPFAAIEAEILSTPCWNLHAGLDATLGIKVQSPDLPVIGSVTLVDWQAPSVTPLDIPLASGGCDAPPDADGDPPPPGSGPDAIHLAMPTYTPWSRTYDGPVDGSNAQSVLHQDPVPEVQRTIDDRFVRSGFGTTTLTKFDELGTLTWARTLALDDGTPLAPLRVRSATDATLLVLSSSPGTLPIVLTNVAQDGSAVAGRVWDVPPDVCAPDVTALASDGAGGAWVVGHCTGDPRSFLLHASGDGSSVFRLLGDLATLRINVIEPFGNGDVFLAGTASENGDALYAFRIAAGGTVVYGKRYDGCAQAPDAIPSAAIIGSQGEVTIAGAGGAQHNGLLLRIRPDGTVGFASFPGFRFGAAGVFRFDSLVELPTTGYVAGGTTVITTGNDPDDVPGVGLVGMDAIGNILWQSRYTFGTTGAYVASGHVGVRLADDGGVVTTALVSDPLNPFGGAGSLWAFKPFVKDGSIDFAAGSVTVTPLGVTNLVCSMTDSDQAITVSPADVPSRAVTVTSTPVTLPVNQQTGS